MKKSKSHLGDLVQKFALAVAGLLVAAAQATAASYEWTFNNGDLSASLGGGIMSYADGATPGLTTFGTTGGGVPNIGGQAANYIHVPGFTAAANGYKLELANSGPNGGGSYINNYTLVFDVMIPSPWPLDYIVPFFNTNPDNVNDGDFYLYGDGEIGIGANGYSAAGVVSPDTWTRIAFVNNGTSLSYYVNGSFVGSQGTGVGVDGRWSLTSNLDSGADVLLFNEPTGLYTHELYLNSLAFVDHAMSASELSGLGGPNAAGILVPEPGTLSLLLLGVGAVVWRSRRQK